MSLFSSIAVSASGMAAQRARTEVLVENLANSETTRTPEGGPYRRKDVVFSEDSSIGSFSSELDSALGTAWDEALEAYRDGGDGAEVSWLSQGVG